MPAVPVLALSGEAAASRELRAPARGRPCDAAQPLDHPLPHLNPGCRQTRIVRRSITTAPVPRHATSVRVSPMTSLVWPAITSPARRNLAAPRSVRSNCAARAKNNGRPPGHRTFMLYGTGIYHDILPNLASHGATAFMRYNTVNITRQALQSRYGRRAADGPFRRCQRALDTRWPAPRTAVNVGVLAEGYRGAARGDCLRAGRASRSGSKFLFTCRKIVYEDARLDCAKEMGARHEWQQ